MIEYRCDWCGKGLEPAKLYIVEKSDFSDINGRRHICFKCLESVPVSIADPIDLPW